MFRYPVIILAVIAGLISCVADSGTGEPPFTACENGVVRDGEKSYPCNNIGLYAHVSINELAGDTNGVRLNDIWGWTDPETRKEYALVGLTDGVAFVDVTDPSEPVVTGKLAEPAPRQKSAETETKQRHDDGSGFKEESDWRDMKVHRNTLYVVSEQAGYGIQVFDLTRLRNAGSSPEIFDEDHHYTLFDNAHNIAINEETEFAYVVGITSGEVCAEHGGLHMVGLETPLQPEFAGCYYDEEAGGYTTTGYIHDTQCVIYRGPDARYRERELCFSSAEHTFLITDVTEKENPETVSVTGYAGSAYSHQGWLTEDHRYFFMNDELDEINHHHNTRTYVWNVENPEDPEMTGYYEHDTQDTDHNLYIMEDYMYQANYTAGLRILDVSNPLPENLVTVGFFDTTPGNSDGRFAGLWSVYPWLSGNKIIASDIDNGLFILRFNR